MASMANITRTEAAELFLWLRERKFPRWWSSWTCASAAKEGRLDILKWLRLLNCPWNSDTCVSAAEGGHLEILQWARSEGCPWTEKVCERAAEGGHLEILQWV